MFGEDESESPRVPSPWDSLISSPRSLSPSKLACQSNGSLAATETTSTSVSPRHRSPSPLLLPRLVPENDSGNVEYKLQLLNPSPARFARLVTQLKWRLLEGGGQAYYELGVADSGDLVGLGREELESSLDTLEMMAGEIGASVIVVKEIEVPAELAVRYQGDTRNNGQCNSRGDARGKKFKGRERGMMSSYLDDGDSISISASTNTGTEEDFGTTDDGEYEEMQMTVIMERTTTSYDAMAVFTMDSELDSDTAETTDISEFDEDKLALPPSQYAIDLEISSVYKPRPMQKRFHHIHPGHQHHHSNNQGRSGGKRGQKPKEKPHAHHSKKETSPSNNDTSAHTNKSLAKRHARDRRREERKQALLAMAARGVAEASNGDLAPVGGATSFPHPVSTEHADRVQAEAETLGEELERLHVGVGSSVKMPRVPESITTSLKSVDTGSTVTAATSGTVTIVMTGEAGNDEDKVEENGDDGEILVAPAGATPGLVEEEDGKADMGLIVEVLVVRKMSIEEGFLDFEGFSFV